MQTETQKHHASEKALRQEIDRLNKVIADLKATRRYGLVWEDKPEEFEDRAKNSVPVLKPKGGKFPDINLSPAADHNVLIEGDNYHALSVLSYTHRGKIDVIYIDPPYNTGSKDFKYNDKYVDADDIFRHSQWLSFMHKRLRIAADLLSPNGLIFVSIDYRESANLQLLLNEVFGEQNYINDIAVQMSQLTGVKMTHAASGNKYPKIKETLFIYAKDVTQAELVLPKVHKAETGKNDELEKYLKYYSTIIDNPESPPEEWKLISVKDYISAQGISLAGDDLLTWKMQNAARLVYRTSNDVISEFVRANPKAPDICQVTSPRGEVYIKWGDKKLLQLSDYLETYIGDIWYDISTINLNKETGGLPTFTSGQKPLALIQRCCKSHPNPNIMILDFFAGSGTTGHAVLELNKQDGGNRRFILVTNNENKIAEEVTYERLKRVMRGYKTPKGENVAGLGGNLAYLTTDFVAKDLDYGLSDEAKLTLSHRANLLLSLRENTFTPVSATEHYEITQSPTKLTAVYFREDKTKLTQMLDQVKALAEGRPVTVYIFSWEKGAYKAGIPGYPFNFQDIPEPIIEVYQSIGY